MALTAVSPMAAERIVSGYNLLLAGVWLAAGGPAYRGAALAHVAGALLARMPRTRPSALRDLYPFLMLPAFWIELGPLRDLLAVPGGDNTIAAIDHALFGRHWNAEWVRLMPWLSEPMEAIYFFYYFVVFAPPVVLALAGRGDACRDVVLRVMATFLACYVSYLAFPVDGPAFTMPSFDPGGGPFRAINHALHASGNSAGTAFPSSHVAASVAMALAAWRWFGARLRLLCALEAAGVCLATVYTQNHYPLDVLAGLIFAFGVHAVLLVAARRRNLAAATATWRTT